MNRTGEALCAVLREGPPEAYEIDLAALTPEQWHDVATLAIRQRVGALLYSQTGLPMPDDVRARLRARAELSARRVLMQQAAFRELAAAVEPLGISLVALKGLHLATSVYPNAALREMGDIDVLALPEQLVAVEAIARELGYQPLYEQPVPLSTEVSQHLPRMMRGTVGLEIHWRLSPPGSPPHVTAEELFDRSRGLSLASNARHLSPEDTVLHLCAHAAGNHLLEMGLRPMCDIRALVQKEPLDWTTVVSRSMQWGCERSVGLILALSRRFFGARVPIHVFDALGGAAPAQILQDSAMTLITVESDSLVGKSEPAARLIQLTSFRERAAHLVSRIALPAAELSQSYPGSERNAALRGLAIVRRTLDVGRRHLWWLLQTSQEREGPVRVAISRRNALADWIRKR